MFGGSVRMRNIVWRTGIGGSGAGAEMALRATDGGSALPATEV